MPPRKVDLRKILQPNDATAFIVILLGLFIALFLDEMAVRLIGVCIAILGGVALFMMISPRIADLSIEQSKRRRVSQPPDMSSDTTQDASGVRIKFRPDEYRQSFGSDEEQLNAFIDDRQGMLFEELDDAQDRSARLAQAMHQRQPEQESPLIGLEIGDADASVRIVGVRSSGAKLRPPALVINTRAARGPSVLSQEFDDADADPLPPQRSAPPRHARPSFEAPDNSFVTGVDRNLGEITEETHLSDDVIVRPKRKPEPAVVEIKQIVPVDAADAVDAVVEVNEVVEEVEVNDEVEVNEVVEVNEEVEAVEVVAPIEPAPMPSTQKARSIPIVMHDYAEDIDIQDHAEPRKEFDALLNRVLQVIRSMVNARTTAFFWVNVDKQQLIIESKITDAEHAFTPHRKLQLGEDVVSQIAIHGRPEILTSIRASAELDLLPYYTEPAGSLSFIGVPVYFGGSVVGVLCADSKEEDTYDAITVGFFGHFTKLISGLIQSYTGKYDLLQSSRILDAIVAFRHAVRERDATHPTIVRSMMQVAVQSMDISTIGAVLFDAEHQEWAISDVRSVLDDQAALIGSTVDIEHTSVGRSILQGTTVVDYGDEGLVRVTSRERSYDECQFVAVPLASLSNIYGALYVENSGANLSQADVAVLEALGEHAGTLLEHSYTKEVVQSGALLDESTGVLNRAGFTMRMNEEFARSIDYQSQFTLCLLQIDGHPSPTTPPAENERILHHVLTRLRNELRAYDIVGRIELGLLAIGLVGSRAQQAQIWTERMRREIASSIIDLDGQRFSVTVSVGVAEADPQDSWETLLENAYHVLRLSEESGNKVTLFS